MQNNIQAITNTPPAAAPDSDDCYTMTDNLIEAICNNSDLPTFGSSVSRLIKLSSTRNGSISELAEFVLSDVSLTQKILRLSNSVNFRTASGPVVTNVSKAIHLLGLETVKSCALAIILVDNMPSKQAQCVRDELAHALTASVIGRELAKRINFKDAEEVAIAALFKNVGRLLVAAYDEQLYEEIMAPVKMGIQTPAQSSLLKLGCSFDMLTEIALQKWQIPEAIIQAMKFLPPKALTAPKTRQEWMRQAVSVSEALTPLIIEETEPDEKDQINDAVLARFGKSLHLDETSLEQLMVNATKHSQSLAESANLTYPVQSEDKASSDKTISRPIPIEKANPNKTLLKNEPPSPKQASQAYLSGKPLNAKKLLAAGYEEIARLISSDKFDNKKLITILVKTIHYSLGFRFATACLKNSHTKLFQSVSAAGEHHATRQQAFFFPLVSSQKDLFYLVMEKGVDLFISNSADAKIQKLIPKWHHTLLPDARSFIVLPFIKNHKPIGLLYADRKVETTEGITADEKLLIKRMKEKVIAALTMP